MTGDTGEERFANCLLQRDRLNQALCFTERQAFFAQVDAAGALGDGDVEPIIEQDTNRAGTLCGQIRRDPRSEEHTSELQSRQYLVCRLLLEKKKKKKIKRISD